MLPPSPYGNASSITSRICSSETPRRLILSASSTASRRLQNTDSYLFSLPAGSTTTTSKSPQQLSRIFTKTFDSTNFFTSRSSRFYLILSQRGRRFGLRRDFCDKTALSAAFMQNQSNGSPSSEYFLETQLLFGIIIHTCFPLYKIISQYKVKFP